ncbi:hypothetical protein MNBD_GAMMA11-1118 [hydrothermal vent metagenome]|uniref:Uncharacterized protein n=1 Tax=hydrothermal vent metagenome TaxID=652676 RepID=A0A3B0X7E3_9ZZZZ
MQKGRHEFYAQVPFVGAVSKRITVIVE